MIVIKLFLLVVLLVPVLFVMGTVASSADILGPFPVGACQDAFYNIAQTGKRLRAATEGFTTKEIRLVAQIVQDLQGTHDIFQETERAHRIKSLVEKSI